MGRHSLWHMDVVSMAVVGVHSVGVWRRTLMCSSAKKREYRLKKDWFRADTNTQIQGGKTLECCVMAVLTWDAASSCVSGPPSSAVSRVDEASAPRPPVPAYGVAGSGGPLAGAGPVGHLS